MFLSLMLLVASTSTAAAPAAGGVIEGTVVRAADQMPVPGAEVALRVRVGGELLLAAETVANAQGRFRFERLPVDGEGLYVPGANRDGIHYPGPRVRLTSQHRRADVRLVVCDAVAFPNPLVVRRHTIALKPRPGVLEVTESMLIDNPTAACYVGKAASDDSEPVTLQLAIPGTFERVTFANEFFGRRFSLVSGKLTTGVPWPPGQRELNFTYLLPNSQGHCLWQRSLDLPSAHLQVSVHCDTSAEVTCNLDRAAVQKEREIAFEAGERTLDAGYLLRVEMGHLPIFPATYASRGALAALASLIVLTSLMFVHRRGVRGD